MYRSTVRNRVSPLHSFPIGQGALHRLTDFLAEKPVFEYFFWKAKENESEVIVWQVEISSHCK